MKLAYLLLAHDFPLGVKTLSERLCVNGDHLYVHVDRKTKIDPFLTDAPNLHYLEKRISTYWGEFSFVKASLALLRKALTESDADYFLLLSQVDYPLTSAEERHAFFERHRGKEFLNIRPMPDATIGKPRERLTRYKYYPVSRRFRLVDWVFKYLVKMDYQKYLGQHQAFGGSGWWGLSREAAEYVLKEHDRQTGLQFYFAHTHIPDEMYIHTLLGNSPFAVNCVGNVTYTDWSEGGSGPTELSSQHLDYFKSQGRVLSQDSFGQREVLFARKMPKLNYTQFLAKMDLAREGRGHVKPPKSCS